MKRLLKIVLVVLALVVVVGAYLLRAKQAPEHCAFTLDLPRLRELARSLPGERPREIDVEKIVTLEMPEAVIYPGGALGLTTMSVYVYELAFPDRTIVIDTAMSAEDAKKSHASAFDAAAWTRAAAAIARAQAVYVTHEHCDHLGGLAALAPSLAPATVHLTAAQLAHLDLAKPVVFPASFAHELAPLVYDDLLAVAPGVVLVKAPGHTPGSQLVYVQLADGRELILTGDTAWHRENVELVEGPPRLTSLLLKNDRAANACQLQALHDLPAEVHVVPGHDARVVDALVSAGLLHAGLR